MRRLLGLFIGLILISAHAFGQGAPSQASAVGYTTLVYGPTLTLCNTADPTTGVPAIGPGCGNVAPFSFFGTSWTQIGVSQNSDGSLNVPGYQGGYGNSATLGASGPYRGSPLKFAGQSFSGGFYAEATMKGTGPMSFWANDVETMNGAGQGWGTTPWPGQPQTYAFCTPAVCGGTGTGSATPGDGMSIYAYAPWLNGGAVLQIPTYTVSSSNAATFWAQMASVINGTTALSSSGVSATGSASGLTINTTTNGNAPAVRFNIVAVSGAFTESLAYTNYADDTETDIAEFDFVNDYAWAFHNWHGTNTSDVAAVWGGPLASCPGGGPNCTWVPPTLNGVQIDFTQYHKYGMLWVPATASTPGYVQYYFDGTPQSAKMFYNKYDPNGAPPPTVNNPTNCVASQYVTDHNEQVCEIPASNGWSVVDQKHLMLILGGAFGYTTTYSGISIWQNAAGMAADIPPISGGGGGTGKFRITGGQIIDPNGQQFLAHGINILWNATTMAAYCPTSACTPLRTQWQGINFIRAFYEEGYGTQDMEPYFTWLNNLGIVVMLTDANTGPGQPPPNPQTTQTNWYANIANIYKADPYIWFDTQNEVYTDGATIATSQQNIYNAIRGTGNPTIVLMELPGGGNIGSVGTNGQVNGSGMTPSVYAPMTNIVWDVHFYGYLVNRIVGSYSTNIATIQGVLNGSVSGAYGIAAAQSIQSADGLVPIIVGEFGNSTDGTNIDSNGQQVTQAVATDGYGYSVFASGYAAFPNPPLGNMLTNSSNQLTSPYGTLAASLIAASAGGGGSTAVAVPAPLTGTVTTGTWQAYDQSFGGITLACGKPFHFQVLPPAQYNGTAYKYPVLIWLHPDFQGDPWYTGANTNPLFLANDESANFNTVPFRTAYPAIVVSPYADQTNGNGGTGSCSGDGNDAVQNWGGWVNTGVTGSGTVYSGDTGPNVFALLDMINYLETQYTVDTSRIYVEGFSLGGIGSEYLMQKYNTQNGSPAVFASGASMAGVLQINGFAAGPTGAQETAMTNVPVWWFSGSNDTQSVPSQWNNPMFTALSGGSSAYPSAITSVAANKAGNSKMEYTLCPTCGHQDSDASGNPVWVNTTIMNWMFGVTGGGGGGGGGGSTTWDPARVPAGMTLSNGNLTASSTTSGLRSDNVVWSTTSYSTGKYCFAVVGTTLSNDWTIGVANNSYPAQPASGAGLGGDFFSEGFYAVGPAQAIYYAAVQLTIGSTSDSSGDEVDECVDFGTSQVWVQTPVMRAAGQTWNNSATANPATGTGGVSISGLTCPCFVVFQTENTPSVATLNASGPFQSGLPSGFAVWTPPASATHSPIFINLGANDNHPPAANDDGWEKLYSPASFRR